MSESKRERRPGRAERPERTAASAASASSSPGFAVVASGENVVLVNTTTGQTWAMTTDGGSPVWHPVAFEGGADRAPRRAEKKAEES